MALKTVLDTLEGVDDALKSFYAETDGKFFLQVEGVDNHPDVANLKSAYERVKQDKTALMAERDTLKAKVAGIPDDFDAEKWSKLKDGKADDAALIAMRQGLEAERDEWKGKYTTLTETARKNAVERDLSDALVKVGVTSPSFMNAARMMLSQQVRVGDDGKAYVETDMGPLGLGDYVTRWAAGDGKDFVTPPTGAGAKGGKGNGGTKTFSEMNGAELVALKRTDPAAYDRLKKG